ncbi:MAG: hypothetical protein ACT4QD_19855 [Acidobacteriota bacterium]
MEEFTPHIAFNLLEEFHSITEFDQHVVSYLDLLQLPHTGCNARGMTITRDKALAKKIAAYHRIRTPRFATFPPRRKVRRPRELAFPIIVKSRMGLSGHLPGLGGLFRRGASRAVAFIHDRVKTEANPNPEIAPGEEFASAAEAAGVPYPELLQKILNLGLRASR